MDKKQEPLWTKEEMKELDKHLDSDPHFSRANPEPAKKETPTDPLEIPGFIYTILQNDPFFS